MRFFSTLQIDWLDAFALGWFLVVWFGYHRYAAVQGRRRVSLHFRMGHWRRQWMRRLAKRENRMPDMNALMNLSTSAQFFASTSVLILGALVALMGYTEKVVDLVAELPFTTRATQRMWEIKILLLLGVFVYAFLKFSWSIRQYGFGSILVAATPDAKENDPDCPDHLERTATVLDYAAENYNNGLRAYYFGLAALAWFLHPMLFVAMTVMVVGILYHREFLSGTLNALRTG